jgi:serralysin
MFDSFVNRVGVGREGRFTETLNTGGAGSAEVADNDSGASAFGAVASYQICACCARFHGPTASEGDGGLGVILNTDDRGGDSPNDKPSLSPGDAGTQITRSNTSWATGLGQAATVTFAFRLSAETMPSDTQTFTQFNTQQIGVTLQSLAAWSEVANITFVRVSDVGEYSNNATILFGNYASGQSGAAAFAYLPGAMPGPTGANQVQGDVWVNSSLTYNSQPVLYGYGTQTLLHEIGHAIGLSHPAAYNASDGEPVLYGPHATYFEDSRQYTVMSYFSERETGADFRINGVGTTYYASAPLMDDIAAAQRLYGANMTTRTGDTVYGFNSNAGQPWFRATTSSSPMVFAVWDAGGTDTFDFSGYTQAQVIDLRQGSFSNVGGMVGNVSIAVGVTIENVIGGTGADAIRGNSADNRITGNGGADVIDGGLGSDTVVFSGARANYTITWNGQVGTVTAAGQAPVTITNVEFLQFADQTIAATPTGGLLVGGDLTHETINGTTLGDTLGGLGGDDTLNGLDGADFLDGGSGTDILNGGDGDDVLGGGAGNDTLNGGAGLDTATYAGSATAVTVNLATGAVSGGGGVDTLNSIENVTGSARADTITGDAGANVLRGGGGIDTLNGGGGDDQLIAGGPGFSGGAPDIIKSGATANGSLGTAVSLSGGFDLLETDNIANSTTIPHATVVATTHNGIEYYVFTTTGAGSVAIDIDGANFDTTLRLLNASGDELARNDDGAGDPGSSGTTDSRLTFNVTGAGTYYIEVARWLSNDSSGVFTSTAPAAGSVYTLNVSVQNQPTVALTATGSTLNGEVGADVLTGSAGKDTLNGGADNDTLNGGAENDTLNGGDGTDTAVFSGARSGYTISTASGVTTVTGADGTDTVTNVERLQFADGFYDITGAPITDSINGTANADSLSGTADGDTINGLGGDDIITGGAGDDTIDGGAGNDTAVFSGAMAGSTVETNAGVTTVTGPDGADSLTNVEYLRFSDGTLIVGAGGGQLFQGTANADTLSGTAFNDQINGGEGDDALTGGAGADAIDGGAGTDTVVFSGVRSAYTLSTVSGVTTVTGPDGTDTLTNVERLQFADGFYDLSGAPIVNTVNGTANADTLTGTTGVDAINASGGDDVITGGTGNDTIDGGAGADTAVFAGLASAYTVSTTGGTTTVTGPDGVDTLTNVERLRFDDATLIVGAGGGQYFAGTANADALNGTAFNDQIEAGAGADAIDGAAGNDTISAGDGDDVITGGVGSDTIDGGAGTDTAVFAVGGVSYSVAVSGGTVTVTSSDGVDTLTNVERLRFAGVELAVSALGGLTLIGANTGETLNGASLNDRLYGFGGADTLNGADGDDVLSGGAGNDALNGGAGSDTADYSGAAGAVTVRIDTQSAANDGDGGTDTFVSIENLTGSAFNDLLVGNGAANVLSGGLGRDTIIAGGGDDTISGGADVPNELYGGAGNDTYIVENRSDSIVENVGEGYDTIRSSLFQVNMAANVEELVYTGTGTFTGVGSAQANVIRGGALRDTLIGGGGDDTLYGGAGAANELYGGTGNDTYMLEVADTIIENADQGVDTVITSVLTAYNLGANVENLTYAGAGAFTAGGNALDNVLTGGTGADILRGRAGNDTLVGGAGSDTADYSLAAAAVTARLDAQSASNDGDGGVDTFSSIENLTGSAFNDTLIGDGAANVLSGGLGRDVIIGGAGADIINGGSGVPNELYGGTGDDTYIVEERTDSIVELAGEGTDTVLSSLFQINLSANVENLTYTGTGTFTGVGNALGNTIRGGTQRDTLLGGGGNDILIGGTGAANELYGGVGDDYYILQVADTVIEAAGAGTDTVDVRILSYTLGGNIENLIFGGSGNFTGTGNSLNNLIIGGAGDDVLRGGGGNDSIRGGLGSDTVVLSGTAGQYTITAEGSDWRVIDNTAGRDGSLLLTGVETLRFSDGSTQSLTPPAAPDVMPVLSDKDAGGDAFVMPTPADDAFVLPALAGKETAGEPLVLPVAAEKAIDADPLVLPGAHDDFLLTSHGEGPLVLPALVDDGFLPADEGLTPALLSLLEHNGLPVVSGPAGEPMLFDPPSLGGAHDPWS